MTKIILVLFLTLFPLISNASNCDEVRAFADIMFGEGENQTEEAKLDLAKFLYSESLKDQVDVCTELYIKKSGGAFKYSSMHHNLQVRKQKNPLEYKKVFIFALMSYNYIKFTYQSIEKYNHYITKHLAFTNPPHWFKNYIIDYKVSGDHIFVNLDFQYKYKEPNRYRKNYELMVKKIKNAER